jgi:hypothetical protein
LHALRLVPRSDSAAGLAIGACAEKDEREGNARAGRLLVVSVAVEDHMKLRVSYEEVPNVVPAGAAQRQREPRRHE